MTTIRTPAQLVIDSINLQIGTPATNLPLLLSTVQQFSVQLEQEMADLQFAIAHTESLMTAQTELLDEAVRNLGTAQKSVKAAERKVGGTKTGGAAWKAHTASLVIAQEVLKSITISEQANRDACRTLGHLLNQQEEKLKALIADQKAVVALAKDLSLKVEHEAYLASKQTPAPAEQTVVSGPKIELVKTTAQRIHLVMADGVRIGSIKQFQAFCSAYALDGTCLPRTQSRQQAIDAVVEHAYEQGLLSFHQHPATPVSTLEVVGGEPITPEFEAHLLATELAGEPTSTTEANSPAGWAEVPAGTDQECRFGEQAEDGQPITYVPVPGSRNTVQRILLSGTEIAMARMVEPGNLSSGWTVDGLDSVYPTIAHAGDSSAWIQLNMTTPAVAEPAPSLTPAMIASTTPVVPFTGLQLELANRLDELKATRSLANSLVDSLEAVSHTNKPRIAKLEEELDEVEAKIRNLKREIKRIQDAIDGNEGGSSVPSTPEPTPTPVAPATPAKKPSSRKSVKSTDAIAATTPTTPVVDARFKSLTEAGLTRTSRLTFGQVKGTPSTFNCCADGVNIGRVTSHWVSAEAGQKPVKMWQAEGRSTRYDSRLEAGQALLNSVLTNQTSVPAQPVAQPAPTPTAPTKPATKKATAKKSGKVSQLPNGRVELTMEEPTVLAIDPNPADSLEVIEPVATTPEADELVPLELIKNVLSPTSKLSFKKSKNQGTGWDVFAQGTLLGTVYKAAGMQGTTVWKCIQDRTIIASSRDGAGSMVLMQAYENCLKDPRTPEARIAALATQPTTPAEVPASESVSPTDSAGLPENPSLSDSPAQLRCLNCDAVVTDPTTHTCPDAPAILATDPVSPSGSELPGEVTGSTPVVPAPDRSTQKDKKPSSSTNCETASKPARISWAGIRRELRAAFGQRRSEQAIFNNVTGGLMTFVQFRANQGINSLNNRAYASRRFHEAQNIAREAWQVIIAETPEGFELSRSVSNGGTTLLIPFEWIDWAHSNNNPARATRLIAAESKAILEAERVEAEPQTIWDRTGYSRLSQPNPEVQTEVVWRYGVKIEAVPAGTTLKGQQIYHVHVGGRQIGFVHAQMDSNPKSLWDGFVLDSTRPMISASKEGTLVMVLEAYAARTPHFSINRQAEIDKAEQIRADQYASIQPENSTPAKPEPSTPDQCEGCEARDFQTLDAEAGVYRCWSCGKIYSSQPNEMAYAISVDPDGSIRLEDGFNYGLYRPSDGHQLFASVDRDYTGRVHRLTAYEVTSLWERVPVFPATEVWADKAVLQYVQTGSSLHYGELGRDVYANGHLVGIVYQMSAVMNLWAGVVDNTAGEVKVASFADREQAARALTEKWVELQLQTDDGAPIELVGGTVEGSVQYQVFVNGVFQGTIYPTTAVGLPRWKAMGEDGLFWSRFDAARAVIGSPAIPVQPTPDPAPTNIEDELPYAVFYSDEKVKNKPMARFAQLGHADTLLVTLLTGIIYQKSVVRHPQEGQVDEYLWDFSTPAEQRFVRYTIVHPVRAE